MGVEHYLGGTVMLSLAIAPMALAARQTRRVLLPELSGPESYMVGSIVFLASLLLVCELLGAVGLFRLWFVTSACVVVGLSVITALHVAAVRPYIRTLRDESVADIGRHPWLTPLIVGALIAVVVSAWCVHTAGSSGGIVGVDSLNYHLPFAARFVQQGRTLPLHYTTFGEETPFDPAGSELLLAVFILPFHRDILAPLVNLGWMTLALLAAWCIGRRRGVGELTLASGALLIAAPLMVAHDAGTASNDIATIALLFAAVALVVNSDGRLLPTAVAATAAGLGLATKLTLAVPVVCLSVGIFCIARGARRWRTVLAWTAPLLLTGGYWYARNLAVIGNPVPAVHIGIGSWRLPSPRLSTIDSGGFTVAHYIGNGEIWHKFFLPLLRDGFGPLWWMVFLLAATGITLSLFCGPVLRILGLVAIASFVAYLLTPTSAGGPRGDPLLFGPNLRFVFPAVGIGLVLLPLTIAHRAHRPRLKWVALVLLVVPLAAERGWGSTAVACALVLTATAMSRTWFRFRTRARRGLRRTLMAGGVVVALIIGFVLQHSYLSDRYVGAIHAPVKMFKDVTNTNALFWWARSISHARIAVVNTDWIYPLYGVDLSNYVQTIGQHGYAGSFEAVTNCTDLREQLNAGRYDYIVATHKLTTGAPRTGADWIGGAGVNFVQQLGAMTIWKVDGHLDASLCPPDG